MAQFLHFDTLATTFGDVLRDRTVLAQLVNVDAQAAADARIGKKIAVRKPRRRVAKRRNIDSTTAVTLETSLEDEVSITMIDDVYDARPITDAELTFDIDEFGVQVLNPMVDAVADYLEGNISDLISTAAYPVASQVGYTRSASTDPAANRVGVQTALLDAWEVLNGNAVPNDDRILVCGSQFARDYLGGITNIATPSENTSSLQAATLPQSVYGFRGVYTASALPANKAYAYHRSAFTVALRAPVVPAGAVNGSSQLVEGFPITVFRDYDATITTDRIVARTFYGESVNTDHVGAQTAAANMLLQRAVEITVAPAV